MKRLLPILILLAGLGVLPAVSYAQQLDHVQGEILIQFAPQTDVKEWLLKWQSFRGEKTGAKITEQLSGLMHICKLRFDHNTINEYDLLEALRRDRSLRLAQFNHRIRLRSTLPNDPQIGRQWQYLNTGQNGWTPGVDLDMDLAWDITTGGVTASGDTIVVCVIDNGLDLDHEDFGGNLWINHQEIPGNQIDDDNNGFVDDYRGWNTSRNNDDIDEQNWHGTPVAGIVGAQGNNGLGVSGVNWDVKLMIVAGGTGVESEVIEAYSLALVHRKRYNETAGKEGAFVVATNASWGVDFGQAADAPIWCAVYDSLGAYGILNVGAAADLDVDVDEEGDLPTTCSSDFLIGVTNTYGNDLRAPDGAFGQVSIDLSAPGHDSWTTLNNNSYGYFDGTSAAAPYVAGAIALLYAAPCPGFMSLAHSDPAAAALLVRKYILEGVTPVPALEGITATGGRLNVNTSIRMLMEECTSCYLPTSIAIASPATDRAVLSWIATDSIRRIDLRWRALSDSAWTDVEGARPPFSFVGLTACTDYEVQFKALCAGDTTDFSPGFVFRSEGCCEIPGNLTPQFSTANSALVNWNGVLAAQVYNLRIRKENEGDWRNFTRSPNSILFNSLDTCTRYEVQIQTVCATEQTGFSESTFFRTMGCGACLDKAYCVPSNARGSDEFIAAVRLNTLNHTSGPDKGYGDFSEGPSTMLQLGKTYSISLEPGFSGQAFSQYFQVWIDLDQDGTFESQERVFDPGTASRIAVSGELKIPADAVPGKTRMRVVMQFQTPGSPCALFGQGLGEVEDYCVELLPADVVSVDDFSGPAHSFRVSPNPFKDELTVDWEWGGIILSGMTLEVFSSIGQPLLRYSPDAGTRQFRFSASPFSPGVYFIRLVYQGRTIALEKAIKY